MRFSMRLAVMRSSVWLALCLVAAGSAYGAIPLLLNHQGVVKVAGVDFTGTGQFRFALVDEGTGLNLWTNDGTQVGAIAMPDSGVAVDVAGGLYSVVLGDASLTNMTALASTVFDADAVVLRIWFDDGTHGPELLTPDQPVTSAAYALMAEKAGDADTLDGQDSAEFAAASHTHNLSGLSGVLTDAQVPNNVTIDYAAAAGHAATADDAAAADDADTLDGQDSTDFMAAGADNWVDTSGDTMTGDLVVGGNLGVGVTGAPAVKLDVDGDANIAGAVTVTSLAYDTRQTRTLSIPSAAFGPTSSSSDYQSTNGYIYGSSAGGAAAFVAPISLPHGARITGYNVRLKDLSSSQDMTIRLMRQFSTGGSAIIANSSLVSSGSSGQMTVTSPRLDEVVNSVDEAYLVEAYWAVPTPANNMVLYHVHVQYAVEDPLP